MSRDLEAWRPALIAFYLREAMPQSAQSLRSGNPLSVADKHVIEALQAAFEALAA